MLTFIHQRCISYTTSIYFEAIDAIEKISLLCLLMAYSVSLMIFLYELKVFFLSPPTICMFLLHISRRIGGLLLFVFRHSEESCCVWSIYFQFLKVFRCSLYCSQFLHSDGNTRNHLAILVLNLYFLRGDVTASIDSWVFFIYRLPVSKFF